MSEVVDFRPPAVPGTARVMRSHLVEFSAPGFCGTASAMRRAAAWLDEHPEPVLLTVYSDYVEETDKTVLVLVVQAQDDEQLERLAGRRAARA